MSKPTIQQRLFAWMLRKGDSINHRIYDSHKRNLFKGIGGVVVEIGPGAGVNMDYLAAGTQWIGIEPNQALHPALLARAEQRGLRANLISSDDDRFEMGDNTADVFICTLVLCSVNEPSKILAEIKRVLKPGGKLLIIEHVASSTSQALLWAQHLFNPFNRLVADGCNCNRRTWLDIENASFSQTVIRHVSVPGTIIFHKPHVVGYAIK
jgi:ubiquinone/menaquinone biosynthesis C-methylase UbiE